MDRAIPEEGNHRGKEGYRVGARRDQNASEEDYNKSKKGELKGSCLYLVIL